MTYNASMDTKSNSGLNLTVKVLLFNFLKLNVKCPNPTEKTLIGLFCKPGTADTWQRYLHVNYSAVWLFVMAMLGHGYCKYVLLKVFSTN